jgi:hypothetical protein
LPFSLGGGGFSRHAQAQRNWASAPEESLYPRSRMQKLKTKPPTAVYALLVVFLFVGMLFIFFTRTRRPVIPNICPIDGQLAQWSKRQSQRDCEYGHFSSAEKKPHIWLAACP